MDLHAVERFCCVGLKAACGWDGGMVDGFKWFVFIACVEGGEVFVAERMDVVVDAALLYA